MGIRETYSAPTKGLLYDFPWERLGKWKYSAFVMVAMAALWEGGPWKTNISMHLLLLAALRYMGFQIWGSASRLPFIYRNHLIQKKGIPFEQVDHEASWENAVILTTSFTSALKLLFPSLLSLPLWNGKGVALAFLLHIGPVEWIYYWAHRALHHHYLYSRYHSHHHSSFVTQPITSTNHPMLEIIFYSVLFAIPILGSLVSGCASIGMYHIYILFIDTMNAWGHCNFEFIPTRLFEELPPLKYLVYSPTFHSLHHSKVHTNFSLFMPFYDYIYGTMDPTSDQLHHQVRKGNEDKVDCMYLTHPTDLLSIFHQPFGFQTFAAHPYSKEWYLWLTWPLAFASMVLSWIFGKPFVSGVHFIGKTFELHTWMIPRFMFQYESRYERRRIRRWLEQCVQEAQRCGCKVVSLGLMNKDLLSEDFMNAEGIDVPIVTGETLSAAIIANRIRSRRDIDKVFMTSINTRIGRAIAAYLCRHGIQVMALSYSESDFEEFRDNLESKLQSNLQLSTSYANAKDYKVWVVDKLGQDEQKWASPGTSFHTFGLFPLHKYRQDCTYEPIAAMSLPREARTINVCEDILPRYVVRPAYAAGILHAREGWKHNDLGTEISCYLMDKTWEAALKHGFSLYEGEC